MMKNFDQNTGFFTHGVLNVTPKESYELCKGGAIIIDVREWRDTSLKYQRGAEG